MMMARSALLSLLGLSLLNRVDSQSPGFLIVSAPRNGKVSWVRLPETGTYDKSEIRTLIDTGLQHPQGIAVDQKRRRLYIADPDVQSIFSYQLSYNGDQLTTDGKKTTISSRHESRWVSVDGVGNVFFSDEPRNLILKVPADKTLRGDTEPEVIYDGSSLEQVNAPGGIAVDNFHVYWTNKHYGQQVGSVVRGSENPEGRMRETVSVLARNSPKSYGLCTALNNLYYTDSTLRLYGVKKNGGPAVEVSHDLKSPRGCAWDGSGTVYVADRGANAIYAFAGEMRSIEKSRLTKAFSAEDAFGLAVAVDTSAAAGRASMLLGAALAVAAALLRC